jgi:hypothetical protein
MQSLSWNRAAMAGSVALEALIAMMLMALFVATAVMTIKRLATAAASARTQLTELQTQSRLLFFLRSTLADLDSHRLAIWPRVHHGTITAADDSVVRISAAFPPDPEGDAISSLQVDLQSLQKVLSITSPSGFSYEVKACPVAGSLSPKTAPRSMIALSVDGMEEVVVDAYRRSGSCIRVRLRRSVTLTLPKNSDPIYPHLLIPVVRAYTLYRDTHGTLRYLGSAGLRTIENQPILDQVPVFHLNLGTLYNEKLAELSLNIERSDTSTTTVLLRNSLARRSPLALLYNLP